jgi:hypothetical protein
VTATRQTIYQVVSYDDDQQQGFVDYVVAKDGAEAGGKIAEVRDYASVVMVYELAMLAREVRTAEVGGLDMARREFQQLKAAHKGVTA